MIKLGCGDDSTKKKIISTHIDEINGEELDQTSHSAKHSTGRSLTPSFPSIGASKSMSSRNKPTPASKSAPPATPRGHGLPFSPQSGTRTPNGLAGTQIRSSKSFEGGCLMPNPRDTPIQNQNGAVISSSGGNSPRRSRVSNILPFHPRSSRTFTTSTPPQHPPQHPSPHHPHTLPSLAQAAYSPTILRSDHYEETEQSMFEQRLCEDTLGIAIRKINSSGKSQLRYVKCVPLHSTNSKTKKSRHSTGSFSSSRKNKASRSASDADHDNRDSDLHHRRLNSPTLNQRSLALTWGLRNPHLISLEQFTAVRKGKSTLRTEKSSADACRLLSLVADGEQMLDVEAPTRLDRDKFARAFARFLGVPIESDIVDSVVVNVGPREDVCGVLAAYPDGVTRNSNSQSQLSLPQHSRANGSHASANHPNYFPTNDSQTQSSSALVVQTSTSQQNHQYGSNTPASQSRDSGSPPKATKRSLHKEASGLQSSFVDSSFIARQSVKANKHDRSSLEKHQPYDNVRSKDAFSPASTTTTATNNVSSSIPIQFDVHNGDIVHDDDDDDILSASSASSEKQSTISSLTHNHFQEEMEDLEHQIHMLQRELESSRIEATRAVKVAEQAIQSAERGASSGDWNSTVTHKAAEAAAQAQKRSAEAMARQRIAEGKLAEERRTASFWRRQAESAEDEAGILQTRAASAEVRRATIMEELAMEQRRFSVLRNKTEATGETKKLKEQEEQCSLLSNRNERLEEETERLKLQLASANQKLIAHDIGGNKENGYDNSTFRSKTSNILPDTVVDLTPVCTKRFEEIKEESCALKIQHQFLRQTVVKEIQSNIHSQCVDWAHKINEQMRDCQAESNALRAKLSLESTTRRKLHHEVQDLRGNVRVYCRPRPSRSSCDGDQLTKHTHDAKDRHNEDACGIISVPSHDTLVLHRKKVPITHRVAPKTLHNTLHSNSSDSNRKIESDNNEPNNNKGNSSDDLHSSTTPSSNYHASSTPLSFQFDRIFSPHSGQAEIYSDLEPMVLGALDGYNITIMAYGQTGSGKTHTMLGSYSKVHCECHESVDNASTTNDDTDDDVDKNVTNAPTTMGEAGILLRACQQFFDVTELRKNRYQDSFSMTVVEVIGERMHDLLEGTPTAEEIGETQGSDVLYHLPSQTDTSPNPGSSSSSRHLPEKDSKGVSGSNDRKINKNQPFPHSKLEIRTNYDGDTVVQGLTSVPITSLDGVCQLWAECISHRNRRLDQMGVDIKEHESSVHVFTTINIISTNVGTGVGTVGKLQCVDLASSDLIRRSNSGGGCRDVDSSDSTTSQPLHNSLITKELAQPPLPSPLMHDGSSLMDLRTLGSSMDWKLANKSLSTLGEVVNARCQFSQSVPYRNSTLTHLLRDCLEGDAKVLLMLCVNTDADDIHQTASALRFASRMKRVVIGKATEHTVSLA